MGVEPGPADPRGRAPRLRARRDRRRRRDGRRHRAARPAHGRDAPGAGRRLRRASSPSRSRCCGSARSSRACGPRCARRSGWCAATGPTIADEAEPLAGRLLDDGDQLLGSFDALRTRKLDAARTRVHGDLHLGQALWTGHDVVFIDFEGEPGRSIGERSIKRSPFTDVAGIVRSLDYAGRVALATSRERGRTGDAQAAQLEQWRRLWTDQVQARYVDCYMQTLRRRRPRPAGAALIPADPADARLLLDAHVLLKALYEVRYELANRPAWVAWPLGADRPDARPTAARVRDGSGRRLGAVPGADGSHAVRGVGARRPTPVEVVARGAGRHSRAARSSPTTAPSTWVAVVDGVGHGDRYRFRLDGGEPLADPASGWQPEGVHGPSAVVDARRFAWTDDGWTGVDAASTPCSTSCTSARSRPAGTLDSAIDELARLARARRHDRRADAAQRLPGRPQLGLRRRVPLGRAARPTAARRRWPASSTPPTPLGLAVVLDVVYNHLGPEGNVLGRYGPYFTDAYRTPWGDAINVAEADSDNVRRTFIESAMPVDRGLPRRRAAPRRRRHDPRPDGPAVPRGADGRRARRRCGGRAHRARRSPRRAGNDPAHRASAAARAASAATRRGTTTCTTPCGSP